MITASSPWETRRIEILETLNSYKLKLDIYDTERKKYDDLFPNGTSRLSDMPAVRSDVFEPERWAGKRIAQSVLVRKLADEATEAYGTIEALIKPLHGRFRTVLERTYLHLWSQSMIADRMFCTRQTVRQWHDTAISLL